MTHQQLSGKAIEFRDLVIHSLGNRRFVYLAADHFIGACPVCGDDVGVRFHGYAPRATLSCRGGCHEAEIAELLGLEVRS